MHMHIYPEKRMAAVSDLINVIRMLPLDMQMRIVIANPEAIDGRVTMMPRDGVLGNEPELLLLNCEENISKALEFRYANTLGRCKSLPEFFVHVNKPYRLTVLHFCSRMFDFNGVYEDILTYAWTSAEFPHQMPVDHLKELFEKADRDKLMTEQDRQKFAELPEVIPVYRGLQDKKAKRRGLSWTTDFDVALWFASRWKKFDPIVLEAVVKKSHVYMYTDGRNEKEVVLNPSHLKKVRVH